jgi:outer membrane protein assembly factor BamB
VGDKVFVTCYSGYGGQLGRDIEKLKRHLVCIDRKSGDILWDKSVPGDKAEDPYTPPGVSSHGYASHTPTSDGKFVFVFFGKSGVFAFDMDGNQKWHVDVGKESGQRRWGSASSPIIYKNTVIVTASDESESIVALDVTTGQEKWKEQAAMLASVWGTPALAEGPNGTEVVLAVPGELWGFNADTGKLRWYSKGNEGASHSVVVADGVVYSIGGGRGGANGVAVKAGGKGEVKELVWENRASGRFASQLVHKNRVYSVNGSVFTSFDAGNGKKIIEERLPQSSAGGGESRDQRGGRPGGDRAGREGGGRGFGGGGGGGREYASPIIAGDKLYIVTNAGKVYVVEVADKFKLVATNDLSFDNSGFSATPAASDGQLIIRSNSHVYCISE